MMLTGIAIWAYLTRPKPESKYKSKIIPACYTLDLIIDMKIAKKLKAEGYNIKKIKETDNEAMQDYIGKPFINIKKRAEYEGKDLAPPELVDSKKKPFNGIVGNGSKVNVVFAAKEWEDDRDNNKIKIAAKLRKVQVLDLVSHESLEEFEEEEGFIAVAAVGSSKSDDVFADDDDDDIMF